VVATARVTHVKIWTSPGGTSTAIRQTLSNPTADGGPLTFLALGSANSSGWVRVLLPERPNGASGWVSTADVSLSTTPYRLVISRSEHQLDVFEHGRRIARHQVGVGKVVTPTPAGTYYLTELIRPPDPSGVYGPYAFGLSAFSTTLTSFAGGPGQLGLHGTDDPKGLGHDVSHGCLRVSNAVISDLARRLPLGTPVEIRN
jgi:lipoprotein-anchoring transpeptidase ErfK/SrfK